MSDTQPSPSFVEVKCKQCDTIMQKRNLENHYKVYHKTKNYKECLVAAKGTLDTFLSIKRGANSEDETSQQPTNKTQKLTPGLDGRENLQKEVIKPDQNTLQHISDDIASIKETQIKILTSLNVDTHSEKKPESQKQDNLEFNLFNSKTSDDLLTNIDWLIICDNP